MATPLTPAERDALVAAHPAWALEGESIRRTFVLPDFAAAIGFVARVALVAEKADHHPDIDIRWNRVTLACTTHSVKALSDLDRDLVAMIDTWGQP
ncbi:MAG: 4a-hydroxytetrahydrobiopterin dehydratase [Acidimicrobiia bacterium]|nr:4a-hydroxytetrahydrobiopterin dehydratase [Acidimicrobiia bacterium]